VAETLFAFTNDDAGMQEPELFAELLDFLDEQQVPATFFVVPQAGGKALDQKPEWLGLLQRAIDAGHDPQHHGFDHSSCFEFGIPPYFMLDILSPEVQAIYAQTPEHFTQHHGYAALRDRLERGREILSRIFGYVPRGFRAPCLAMCENSYRALHDLDFRWSTNQVVNPMGWRYINRDYDRGEPWQPDVPPRPYPYQGVIEAPMLSEYTWYLTPADVDRHFALIRADYDRTVAAGGSFVVLSHYYAMTGQWAAGLEVYRRLFAHARDTGDVRFVTLSELVANSKPQMNADKNG
jgi:peptidoglycan/xylan/chitin deacetylase (PgdA/CDA1 family)